MAFLLLLFVVTSRCIREYTYIFLNITSVCIALLVCVFSDLVTRYEIMGVLISGDDSHFVSVRLFVVVMVVV